VTLRIGTRRSRLALAQAREVQDLLSATGVDSELVEITTSGDRGAPASASPAGMKGLFVAEIVQALRSGDVDLAVHSAKDLPADEDEGVVFGAVPERLDPSDVFVHRDETWNGGLVGTSSIRRTAQLAHAHPELRVVDIRGNVDTRLSKLEAGEVQGLVLAAAGLARLGVRPRYSRPLPVTEMVPAPGQGALAIQVRAGDDDVLGVVSRLDDAGSRTAFDAERRLMASIGGGCALPLGAVAEPQPEGGVRLRAVVVRPDGSELVSADAVEPTAALVAARVAEELLRGGAGQILFSVRSAAS
jgi:hydroxymethylbilane synthase